MADRLVLRLVEQHPDSAAQTLRHYAPEDAAAVLGEVAEEHAARLLQHMMPLQAARALQALPPRRASAMLGRLAVAPAAHILSCLATQTSDALLHAMPLLQGTALKNAMRYPAGTAGSIMRADILTFTAEMTVTEAKAMARASAARLPSHFYVLDATRRPLGHVDAVELWLAEEGTVVGGLLKPSLRLVTPRTSLPVIARDPAWLNVSSLPVVDGERRLLGVLEQSALALALLARRRDSGADATLTDAAMAIGELVWTAGAAVIENAASVPDDDRR